MSNQRPITCGMPQTDWALVQQASVKSGVSHSSVMMLVEKAETDRCKEWLTAIANRLRLESIMFHKEEYSNQSM